jgi:hypothetical protein
MFAIAARMRPLRIFFLAAIPLGSAAFVSGGINADLCRAYGQGRIGAVDSARPLLCDAAPPSRSRIQVNDSLR